MESSWLTDPVQFPCVRCGNISQHIRHKRLHKGHISSRVFFFFCNHSYRVPKRTNTCRDTQVHDVCEQGMETSTGLINRATGAKRESEEQLSPSSGCQEVIIWFSGLITWDPPTRMEGGMNPPMRLIKDHQSICCLLASQNSVDGNK